MNWIEANGAALRYELGGSGARTVVLIHEAGGSLESWDAVLPELQRAFRTLRYDQRGFGMSERASTLSLAGMVEDLRCLLDALKLVEPVHLIGTAFGGTIAIAFAAAHPTRAASITATSPVTGNLPQSSLDSLEQRALSLEREGIRPVAEVSLMNSYPPALRHDAAQFAQYRGRFLGNDPQSFAALSRAFMTIDLAPMYAAVLCPALIVGCTHDPIKPLRECAEAAAAMPKGRFAEAPSGHFIAVQSPELLLGLVKPFLENAHAA